ncbi:MAG: low specificity L-threonine aldolase [Acidobacteria bacterium]|nr:low specificity L-threonine aldolase [Acidobacteriota bacterium]
MRTEAQIKFETENSLDTTAVVDLRSDTVTKPTPEMRRAMAEAEVGDDVYGEDPTVNRLEARAAEIFGREAGLFVPTGTMGNSIAMRMHTRPGQEVVCEQNGHIYNYEMAAMSAIAGCLARPIVAHDGILTWPLVKNAIRPKSPFHAQTGLISCENTHNIAGGKVLPTEVAEEICDQAHAMGIPVHLDGARIFNAAVALGRSVREITAKFDSIMFCVSKGLGAPVGSLLLGSCEFIAQARQHRKILGGGMRQAGVLAAAALVALEKSPQRLHIDHEHAKVLAEKLAAIPGIRLDPEEVVTNIIVFDVTGTGMTSFELSEKLKAHRILANGLKPSVLRMVTHCDVDRADCLRAAAILGKIVQGISDSH